MNVSDEIKKSILIFVHQQPLTSSLPNKDHMCFNVNVSVLIYTYCVLEIYIQFD